LPKAAGEPAAFGSSSDRTIVDADAPEDGSGHGRTEIACGPRHSVRGSRGSVGSSAYRRLHGAEFPATVEV